MNGLQNIGNTCYMNSGLQLLLNVNELHIFLNKYKNVSETINKINNFFTLYKSSENHNLVPDEIKQILGKRKKNFIKNNQEDSSEFIVFLFDIINNELKNNKVNDSLFSIFGIISTNSVKCKVLKCLNESITKSSNLFLQLPSSNDLTESYRKYKEYEKLDGNNKYMCEKCNKLTVARKKMEIKVWPKNLIITLNRFNNFLQKNDKKINIPFEWRHNYKLVGGVIHMGNLSGGHYIYFGKKNGKWYIFDDSSVKLVQSNDQLNNLKNTAYILHFKMYINIDE